MLTNLTLENFKAFQKLDDLKIKPITILCGTNSCGKSSILQSILLLKQTLEGQNPNQNLLLNGRFVKLGYFQDVLHKKNIDNSMSFDFTFDISFMIDRARDNRGYSLPPLLQDLIISKGDHGLNKEYLFNYRISLKKPNKNNEDVDYLEPLDVVQTIVNIYEKNKKDEGLKMSFSLDNEGGNAYDFNVESSEPENKNLGMETALKALFPNMFDSIKYISDVISGRVGTLEAANSIYRFKELLQRNFRAYSYLGPQRAKPEKNYIFENEIIDIGNNGENAAFLYFREQNRRIGDHYFFNSSRNSFEQLHNQTLNSGLLKWFELMKIPRLETELNNKIIYVKTQATIHDETPVGIAEVGFGISQLFPIILEGLRMEKGNTLMLEEPEIHLHPNLQMQMADYFISLALSGKQVLVETHSDHVINRLVRRIVEDETHNLQDLIGIYFIKPSENGSVYEEVKIDETKGIVNWPPDFFDQTANEQMKIMQAGLKKRKNQRVAANDKNS